MKVLIFGGFPLGYPTNKATASKLRVSLLSEYGSQGFRVWLRRLSEYGSSAYLVERTTQETGRKAFGHHPIVHHYNFLVIEINLGMSLCFES